MTAAVAAGLAVAAVPALAGQVVNDGFESGLGGWTVTTGGDGTFAVQGAEVATGAAAARWAISANTGSVAYARRSVGAPLSDVTVTFAGRVDVEGATGSNVPLLRLLDASNARLVYVYRQNLSSNRVYVSYNGGFFQTTGTLALGVFARFSLHVIVNGAASTVSLTENGTSVYSTTTASLPARQVASLQLGNEVVKQAGTAVIDDVVAYDANGSDTLIAGGPAGPTSSPAPSFTFSSPDATATFQCNLDGGAYAACASPKAYTGLADGPHTFNVRAVDAAGYVDPTPATRSFTVDTVAPDTSITSAPTGTVTSSAASIAFTSPDATATFQCSLDAAAYAACASPKSYSGLADGPHTFQVKAVDPAGNVDPTPASASWTVSTGSATPPDTSITGGQSGTVATSSASFTFTSPDGTATFECALDTPTFTACTSPKAYTGLADGSHTFQVRAVNAAGPDPSPASRTWTVDTTAPETTIDSGPNGTVTTSTVAFTFSSPTDATATFACSLDGVPFTACTSPQGYSGLANGAHTFRVEAIDGVGNVDQSPAIQTFTVNVTSGSPPETSIDSGPSGPVNVTTATFAFSSPDPTATFECNRDGAGFSACTSPVTYTSLPDGPHTLLVRAVNAAGPDATPASRSWTVDTQAPDTAITAGPSGSTKATSATFSFSSPDATATFQCSLDGVPFATCASPATYSSLADGPHTFQVKAIDPVGNADPTPAQRTWTVDTVPPSTVIDSGPTGIVPSASATFTFHSPDATATFQCSLDSGSFAACTSPDTLNGLANGTHAFTVQAVDPAGNADPSAPSRTWTVSVSAARRPTDDHRRPAGPVNSGDGHVQVLVGRPTATFECSLDSALFAGCASPKTYSGLAQGPHAFQVRAVTASEPTRRPTRAASRSTHLAGRDRPHAVARQQRRRVQREGDSDVLRGDRAGDAHDLDVHADPQRHGGRRGGRVERRHEHGHADAGGGAPAEREVRRDARRRLRRHRRPGGQRARGERHVELHHAGPARRRRRHRRLRRRERPAKTEALLASIPGDVFADGDTSTRAARDGLPGLLRPELGPGEGAHAPGGRKPRARHPERPAYDQYSGTPPPSRGPGTTASTSGSWHVVVLNSNCSA